MSSSMVYSEADLESDVELFMKEALDLSLYSILDGEQFEKDSKKQAVYHMVDDHLKNMRFLAFANEFLESERTLLECGDWEMVNLEDSFNNFGEEFHTNVEMIEVMESSASRSVTKSHATKADLKQLRKDLERDQLIVNGKHLIGSTVLLDGMLETIKTIIQRILMESSIPELPSITSDHLTHAILYKASRTHSGGIVFSTLQGLIDPDKLLLVPQSSMSPPIVVHIRLGTFMSDSKSNSLSWGLICKVSSEAFYFVNKMDDMMDINERSNGVVDADSSYKGQSYAGKLISATFEDFIYFDIKYYGNEMSNIERIIGNPSAGPIVKIRILAQEAGARVAGL